MSGVRDTAIVVAYGHSTLSVTFGLRPALWPIGGFALIDATEGGSVSALIGFGLGTGTLIEPRHPQRQSCRVPAHGNEDVSLISILGVSL